MAIDSELEEVGFEDAGHAHTRLLESKAVKGTYSVVAFYGLGSALRLISSIVLSRLFLPEFYGVVNLVTTVIVGMNLFSHIGLEDNVIQNPRGDEPAFLNTAWTLQVLRGALLWLGSFLLAWPMANFYHEPRMAILLPILGFGCLLASLTSPGMLSLSRHMGVAKISLLELVTQFITFVVTLIYAEISPTLWALVVGRTVSELCRTLISYKLAPGMPRFTWERDAVRSLVKFGRWILIGTALYYLASQADKLILGKLVDFRTLGVYGIAFSLSDIPRQIILQFCNRVGYPFIAKFSALPREEYRKMVMKYRMPVLAAGALLLVLVICLGDQFILRAYKLPYHAASWMIAILAVGLWHTLMYSTIYPAIMSLQKSHYGALGNFLYCTSLFIALPLGFHWIGMVGAVIAVAISDLPLYFVSVVSASREGISAWRQDILMTAFFLGLLGAALALRFSIGLGSPFPHIW
jgi:O-antigen/teichoic acid export membrane protein